MLGGLSRAVPFVRANLGALVAIVFIYIPVLYARLRHEDLIDYGFHFAPIKRGLMFGLGGIVVIFPVFIVGFVIFYDIVCAAGPGELLGKLAPPGMCPRYRGMDGMRAPPIDFEFAKLAFFQIIVVALPEELFFRGFVQKMLEKRWKPKRRILGGGIGLALVVASALFAVVHTMVIFDPRRLAVFFPSLVFGWMRSATGSIFASVLFHAACNLFIEMITPIFF